MRRAYGRPHDAGGPGGTRHGMWRGRRDGTDQRRPGFCRRVAGRPLDRHARRRCCELYRRRALRTRRTRSGQCWLGTQGRCCGSWVLRFVLRRGRSARCVQPDLIRRAVDSVRFTFGLLATGIALTRLVLELTGRPPRTASPHGRRSMLLETWRDHGGERARVCLRAAGTTCAGRPASCAANAAAGAGLRPGRATTTRRGRPREEREALIRRNTPRHAPPSGRNTSFFKSRLLALADAARRGRDRSGHTNSGDVDRMNDPRRVACSSRCR